MVSKKFVLTEEAYDNLLAHLVDFEERRSQIINLYFPDFNWRREEFEKLIDNYIDALDNVVKNASLSDKAGYDFPFVCLNSEVEIEDIDDHEIYNYRVIIPETSYNGSNCITIFSPMGKALLRGKVQEIIEVDTPSGIYRYRIRSISLKMQKK